MLEQALPPGTVVDIGGQAELAPFEDIIAPFLKPGVWLRSDHESWAGRLALHTLIRPPGVHGTVSDISLTVMEDPYKQLTDAKERQWNIPGARNLPLPDAEAGRFYMGFTLTAPGPVRAREPTWIETEVYYASRPPGVRRKDGNLFSRFVAVPQLRNEPPQVFAPDARHVGLGALRVMLARLKQKAALEGNS
jgi:hypothetical protein